MWHWYLLSRLRTWEWLRNGREGTHHQSIMALCRLRGEQEQRAAKFSVLHSTFGKKEAALRERAEHAEADLAALRAQAMELAAEAAAAQR